MIWCCLLFLWTYGVAVANGKLRWDLIGSEQCLGFGKFGYFSISWYLGLF